MQDNIFSFEGTPSIWKSGDNSGEATPVPISNTEVKLLSADDTWWEAAWESRTLPVFLFPFLFFVRAAWLHFFYFLERNGCAFFFNSFFTCGIILISMISERKGMKMTILKILFTLLLCVPMLLLVFHFFGHLVDDILKHK